MATENKEVALDQADIIALNERLTADLATANGKVTALEGEKATLTTQLSEANGKLATANTNLATVTTDRDNLKTENTRLQGEVTNFNAKVAGEVAKAGIRKEAPAAAAITDKKLTATEKCLAAKAAQAK